MKGHSFAQAARRLGLVTCAMSLVAAASATAARAITYSSGDVLYVAYQNSPSGAEYVVNLGNKNTFLNATTCFDLTDVKASDLDTIVGGTAPNIFVGLFGVELPTSRDGIISANGPKDDFSLDTASIIGAVQQIDFYGNGLSVYSQAVPSGTPTAGKFTGASTGSYQATLNKAPAAQGSLANNVGWSVETRLSSNSGVRNGADVKIRFYVAERNPFSGLRNRRPLAFFTLRPNGTIRYCPDGDGDLIANDGTDLCPTVSSTNNTDGDGDLRAQPCDCNDANNAIWAKPTEVPTLTLAANKTSLSWTLPLDVGGTQALQYDVFRELSPLSGATVYDCYQGNISSPSTTDASSPGVNQTWNYLVRAQNGCGEGSIGSGRPNNPRTTAACP